MFTLSRRILLVFLLISFTLLISFLVFNTIQCKSLQINIINTDNSLKKDFIVDHDEAIERLSAAIKIPTISHDHGHEGRHINQSNWEWEHFDNFELFLKESFTNIFSKLNRINVPNVCNHTLLFKWEGTNKNLLPLLLMGHFDVVPVEEGTFQDWEYPPFSGKVKDGFIWGRGSIDDKGSLIAIFESVEILLKGGFKPTRTVYMAAGHDEEVGGTSGASKLAGYLKKEGIKFELVVDEGGAILEDLVSGIEEEIAVIGISEKGYLSVELSVTTNGGHSSMPPLTTSIGILSAGIAKLEANQRPSSIDGVTDKMLDYLAPHMPFFQKFFVSNRWLFRPLLLRLFEMKPTLNAMIRTTTAVTVIHAGKKDNVLPQHASAIINFRTKPGDSTQDIIDHIHHVVNDDRIKVSKKGPMFKDASPISSTSSFGWNIITKTIKEEFPYALVAPYIVLGATDGRYMHDLSDSVYRCSALRMKKEDMKRVHGTNERIGVENYIENIEFFTRLIINAQESNILSMNKRHSEL